MAVKLDEDGNIIICSAEEAKADAEKLGSPTGQRSAQGGNNFSKEPADMLKDAKQYARQDWTTIEKMLEKAGIEYDENQMVSCLIAVKYEQISTSRLNRNSLFD